jgi:hypothetical protein
VVTIFTVLPSQLVTECIKFRATKANGTYCYFTKNLPCLPDPAPDTRGIDTSCFHTLNISKGAFLRIFRLCIQETLAAIVWRSYSTCRLFIWDHLRERVGAKDGEQFIYCIAQSIRLILERSLGNMISLLQTIRKIDTARVM